jgi:putative membrane protein
VAAPVLAEAGTDYFRWQPHPEVWLLLGSLVALALYATRVLGPKVVPDGEPVVSRRQKGFFIGGMLVLWLAVDWPLHDIAEEHLYTAHMVQHFLLTLVVPPLFLLATPTWLARAVAGDGRVDRLVHRLARPVPVVALFAAATMLTHWAVIVNLSVEVGWFHYVAHVAIVTASLLVWMPICGPYPELRSSLPVQMMLLFLLSIIPTVPAGWLTFSETVIYDSYDHGARMWDITVLQDQQAAGLFMKIAGTFYLWGVIATIFFTWAMRHESAERAGVLVSEREVLTWDAVHRELAHLETAEPAPTEPS